MNNPTLSPEVQEELKAIELKFGQATSLLELTLYLEKVSKALPNDYELGNYIRKFINNTK